MEKRRNKRYTEEEKAIIIEQLKLYPDNRNEAFRVISTMLKDRAPRSIENYYQNNIKNNSAILIGTVGSNIGFTHNRKNNPVREGQTFKRKEPLNPVIYIMKELLNLSQEDRQAIISFLAYVK